MTRWHTVTPIHNLDVSIGSPVDFGSGLQFAPLPDWIAKDSMVERLSATERQSIQEVRHAFVSEYEAASLGDPDPAWKGSEPKGIQETKYELAVLGNLALWLSCPSPACFTVVLHAPQFESKPVVQQTEQHSPLLCHPIDVSRQLSLADINLAQKLHVALVEIPRQNAIWTAIRSAWFALQMSAEEVRYSLWWIALEALFGPEDPREITYRLSQRIAFFLGQDKTRARDFFSKAKAGYAFRSKVVHGRWKENPDNVKLMADAELFVRTALNRIILDAKLTKAFQEKNRETYLDELVFQT
jgi:hypothetical protein